LENIEQIDEKEEVLVEDKNGNITKIRQNIVILDDMNQDMIMNKIDEIGKEEENLKSDTKSNEFVKVEEYLLYENKSKQSEKVDDNVLNIIKSDEFEKIDDHTQDKVNEYEKIQEMNENIAGIKIKDNQEKFDHLLNKDELKMNIIKNIDDQQINIHQDEKDLNKQEEIIVPDIEKKVAEDVKRNSQKEILIVNDTPNETQYIPQQEPLVESDPNKIEDDLQEKENTETIKTESIITAENADINTNEELKINKEEVAFINYQPLKNKVDQPTKSETITPILTVHSSQEIIKENINELNPEILDENKDINNINVETKENIPNIQRLEEITATEENSNNPISIENENVESLNNIDITDNNEINPQIILSDIKEPIMLNDNKIDTIQSDITNNMIISSENLIQMDSLNNGVSLINNEIISDIIGNAFESITPATSEKTSTNTAGAQINIEVIDTNNLEPFEEYKREVKKEKTNDKIVTVEIPIETQSEIKETKPENTEKYSEIVSIKKLEDKEEKKVKKIKREKGSIEKYAPWLFFSIGGIVLTYFIYRRFAKYK
jgi:hypothetical protein